MAESLPADLAARIDAEPRLGDFGRLEYHATVESTNDLAQLRAAMGAPEGTGVLAEQQRAGRGRRGRTWSSPAGAGIYLSVVTRPAQASLSLVTIAAGVAAARAVTRVTGLPVSLKWPNDLVVGRAWHKLGGILCEAAGTPVDAVVVGVGINLTPTAYPPSLAGCATSIEGELGRPADRSAIVVEVLVELRGLVDALRLSDRSGVLDAWRQLAAAGSFDAAVRWRDQGHERHGVVRGIDDDGALLVDTGRGRERITAGEVSWEPRA